MPDTVEDVKCVIVLSYYGDNEYSLAAMWYRYFKGIPKDKLQMRITRVKLARSEHSPSQGLKY